MKSGWTILAVLALAGCAAQPRPQTAPPPAPPAVPTVPIPPPPPRGEPETLTGIDAQRLQALMGPPVFTRKEGAIDMWRYDTATCHAFFFLSGAPAKVQHVETIPRGPDNAADPACLSALRKPS